MRNLFALSALVLAATAWAQRGAHFLEIGRMDDAIADFDKAVKLDPKASLAWASRGVALARKKQNEQAAESLDKRQRSVRISPISSTDVRSSFRIRAILQEPSRCSAGRSTCSRTISGHKDAARRS